MFQSVISLIPMTVRVLFAIGLILVLDMYAYQAIRVLTEDSARKLRKTVRIVFWVFSIGFYVMALLAMGGYLLKADRAVYVTVTGLFSGMFLAKILMMLPLLMEDVYRLLHKFVSLFRRKDQKAGGEERGSHLISRKKFVSRFSAGIGALTFSGFTYGIVKGAHDYKVHRAEIELKNLPPAFKGLRIGHLSDIHSGSFWDKEAVRRGVARMMEEKPDVIFFTGDLVNSLADEMSEDYIRIFSALSAPMGIYSILGNHDYGDYHQWPDRHTDFKGNNAQSDKSHMSPLQKENLDRLISKHKEMGWELLLNEHRILERGEDKIALLGVENYGAKGRFARYGVLSKAYEGTEHLPVKLLLSHDPSHWDAEVRKKFSDIDVTFSGHTHGAQFGIETAGFRWSPIQFMYKQWAGLYRSGEQYIYVNRGYGYLGYPGRLGIRPEIGIITLL